jgi:glycerol-3-phosphate dehydrogenase
MKINLNKFEKNLSNEFSQQISCREWHSSIVIEGSVNSWQEVISAGKLASKLGYKGVVNKLQVKNLEMPQMKLPELKDHYLDNKKYDVVVIGAGIIGSSIARELSKWKLSVLVLEKESDIAMQTSSRNDGMIHPGIEPKPSSKKALFNIQGNELYTKITKELDVPFQRNGSNILFNKSAVRLAYPILKARAKKNGVIGMNFLTSDEIRKLEPNIVDGVACALHFNSTGVLSPYKMTVAYAENAAMNGVEFSLNTAVLSMEKYDGKIFSITTNRGKLYPKLVINAAGVFSDEIAAMAGDQFFTIHPRKGEVLFLDKKAGRLLNSVVAMPPLNIAKGNTKGGGLVKTIDGNILVGPDAYEQPFKEDYSSNKVNMDALMKKHLPLIPLLKPNDVITYCAGTRAATYEEDFIVEKSEYVENLIHAAGIQSPGLASAPAIALEIEKLSIEVLKSNGSDMDVIKKNTWNPFRKSIPDLSQLPFEERSKLIKIRPDYGIIVCRCEEISKGEIVDAVNSIIPATTVDGIKRRVRAGMGRCQGGFCLPLVMEIMAEANSVDMLSITKKGNNSNILLNETKHPNEEINISKTNVIKDNTKSSIKGDEETNGTDALQML